MKKEWKNAFPPVDESFKRSMDRAFVTIRKEQNMRYENKRQAHSGVNRRMIAVLVALLMVMLAATAFAVVRGNLLRARLEAQGDETIAAQVQNVHVSDVANEFGFTIDEVVWENDKIFLSYQVSVPDDGNSYLYGIYVPELNGEPMSYGSGSFFNAESMPQVYALGNEFPCDANKILQELIADPALKDSTDNTLHIQVDFYRTNRPIRYIAYDELFAMTTERNLSLGNRGWFDRVLDNSEVLYYWDEGADIIPSISLGFYPEVEDMFARKINALSAPQESSEFFSFGGNSGDEVMPFEESIEARILSAEEFASTGIAEFVTERDVTIPLNVSETQDTIYNDVAEHVYEMDEYTIEIADFSLTHFEANYRLLIRKDGAWAENEEDEPLMRNYELLRKDGSCLSEESGGMEMHGYAHDPDGEQILYVSIENRGFFALDGITELMLAPVIYNVNEEGSLVQTQYLLNEAISITPIYNPDRNEATLLTGHEAANYGGMWFVGP